MTTLLALLLLSPAHAEDGAADVEIFRPHGDLYGYAHTQSATTLSNLQLSAGAWVAYANDPVILVDADGNRVRIAGTTGESGDALVDDRVGASVHVGLGFLGFGSVVVDVPFTLVNDTWSVSALDTGGAIPVTGAALGDLRVTPKFTVLEPDGGGIGVALAVPTSFPTAPARDLLGSGGFSATPRLIAEVADGSVRQRAYKVRAAVNAGYAVRTPGRVRDVAIGGGVDYAAAVAFHPATPFEALLEVHGTAGASIPQSPMEALVGAKFLIGRWVTLDLGGGAGVIGGVGAPDWRLYGGLQVAPSFDPSMADGDDDGLVDGRDRCPKDAEDRDGYEDEDGCPDRDNDADGREDSIDQCVNDPEDDDGFLDNDGCPEPDNDKDGVNDVADRCPNDAENVNGAADDDGCPDDTPIADTDGDGIDDPTDRCPRDPEDMNAFEDDDGCPDERLKNARVVVTQSSIKIKDVIYFDTGKSTIQERSNSLLDEIAAVIVEHRELTRIRVEGHTDDVGNDLTNLKLSQARAEAVVRYLVSKGVAAERLDAAGFGEMRPIAPNTTDDGRSQNRRVEFIIVDRD